MRTCVGVQTAVQDLVKAFENPTHNNNPIDDAVTDANYPTDTTAVVADGAAGDVRVGEVSQLLPQTAAANQTQNNDTLAASYAYNRGRPGPGLSRVPSFQRQNQNQSAGTDAAGSVSDVHVGQVSRLLPQTAANQAQNADNRDGRGPEVSRVPSYQRQSHTAAGAGRGAANATAPRRATSQTADRRVRSSSPRVARNASSASLQGRAAARSGLDSSQRLHRRASPPSAWHERQRLHRRMSPPSSPHEHQYLRRRVSPASASHDLQQQQQQSGRDRLSRQASRQPLVTRRRSTLDLPQTA